MFEKVKKQTLGWAFSNDFQSPQHTFGPLWEPLLLQQSGKPLPNQKAPATLARSRACYLCFFSKAADVSEKRN